MSKESVGDRASFFGALQYSIGDRLVGPFKFLTAENERLKSLSWDNFSVDVIGMSLGGIVSGINLGEISSSEQLEDIRSALHEYKVLVFKNQFIDSEQQVNLAYMFGELVVHEFLPRSPENVNVSRLERNEFSGGYENAWHTDFPWLHNPPKVGILRAVEIPNIGGDTMFCDMYAAYEGLEDWVKPSIEASYATYDVPSMFNNLLDEAGMKEMNEKYPPAKHPLSPFHPITGKQYIYLSEYSLVSIHGNSGDTELIHKILMAQSKIPEYQLRVKWEDGMVVMWDNLATQHYAVSDYWPKTRIVDRVSAVY